jgi:ATP synthase protein I
MNEREKNDPLRELGERLDKARAASKGPLGRAPDSDTSTGTALALGWRVGIELLGAIVVAVFIGWAIDRWFGTRPWGTVIFFFLGVAVGMLNVYRAVTGLGRAVGFRQNAPTKPSPGWDDDED